MKNRTFLSFIFLLSFNLSFGQESISVMHYNLLYYGKTTDYCTTYNNNVDTKNSNLRTLFNNFLPDILTVNEMDGSSNDVKYLLDNALNQDGRSQYASAAFSGSYLVNMLYYNTEKLALKEQSRLVLGSYQRDANFYKLYYKAPDLEQTKDTVWLKFVVLHLKAGSTTDDKNLRATQITKVMDELERMGWNDNVLLSGDLNLYTNSENAWEGMIAPNDLSYAFYDPLGREGSWHNNASYADVHTQSTHSSSGCASSGGMDDRFDFILVQENLLNETSGLSYREGSYKAIGQDGNHYNQAINSGTNADYSWEVVNALYAISDHLPVYMELEVTSTPVNELAEASIRLLGNPVHDNIVLQGDAKMADMHYALCSITGVVIASGSLETFSGGQFSIPVGKVGAGIYLLRISSPDGTQYSQKVIIQ